MTGAEQQAYEALRAAIRAEVADELREWAMTMPDYKPPKGGTTGRAVALAAANRIERLTQSGKEGKHGNQGM